MNDQILQRLKVVWLDYPRMAPSIGGVLKCGGVGRSGLTPMYARKFEVAEFSVVKGLNCRLNMMNLNIDTHFISFK